MPIVIFEYIAKDPSCLQIWTTCRYPLIRRQEETFRRCKCFFWKYEFIYSFIELENFDIWTNSNLIRDTRRLCLKCPINGGKRKMIFLWNAQKVGDNSNSMFSCYLLKQHDPVSWRVFCLIVHFNFRLFHWKSSKQTSTFLF